MGMYTELNLGVEIANNLNIIHDLKIMLGTIDGDIVSNHDLFKTRQWDNMLLSDSYYFDGQTDSKLFRDDLDSNNPMYYLNVRCNLKNYDNEIKLFLDWLCPYILTEGFLGYMRYEESYAPTLIYKKDNEIIYNEVIFNDMG